MRKVFGFIIIILMLSFLSNYFSLAQTEDKRPKAPNFFIRDINGKRIELAKLLKKGFVLLDFWALWCIPCRKELPHLQDIYNRYKQQGLIVLTVNEDDPSTESKVKPFVKGNRYNFLVVIDKDKELWRKFKIVTLPTSILIDQHGNIQKNFVGYRPGDEKQLEEEIKQLLSITTKK